ncbi:MAG TPA: YicC/YloC family endoribonuclease [Bacteroidales bacterium]|nr:YicC/YloC family endoribonuclease [Bacteroidales bacterium]
MIQSMTGFGKSTCELDDKVVNIEIKSLNSKQLDVYMRLTGNYREKEMEIRNELTNRLKRGKVEVLFSVEYKEGRQATHINAPIIKDYYNQLRSIAEEIGIAGQEPLLQAVLRLPETFNNGKESIDPDEWAKLQVALNAAIDGLEQFRIQEGKTLENDVISRIKCIESFLARVEPFEKERYESLTNKMKNSLLEFVPQERIDNNRFEQELIYYIEKLDISEEKTRLQHHCNYFLEVINEPEQVGRKLGFVAQEIGREINTIGSKANHSGIQKLVVLMKDELEKVKEQLMNVL